MIIVTAVLVAAGIMFSPYFPDRRSGNGNCGIIIFPRFNVEYEYQYMNGEIDIDEIFSKSKTQKVTSLNLANVECRTLWLASSGQLWRRLFCDRLFFNGFTESAVCSGKVDGTDEGRFISSWTTAC